MSNPYNAKTYEAWELHRDDAVVLHADHLKALDYMVLHDIRKGNERYEKVRKFSPRVFLHLSAEAIRTGRPFDELVDEF
ncbi:MAG TPA: hypothetical protein VJZ49_15445 [Syntrophales bacterium]|nr:hypothetical protein [Syntrophales bacterium]